ncbi:hypothetical protein JCM10213_006110 [Rhodosporidiobolus nylandii]
MGDAFTPVSRQLHPSPVFPPIQPSVSLPRRQQQNFLAGVYVRDEPHPTKQDQNSHILRKHLAKERRGRGDGTIPRHVQAVAQRTAQDGFDDDNGSLQVGVIVNSLHKSPLARPGFREGDQTRHLNVVFFQVVGEQLKVQWWRDAKGNQPDNVYETEEEENASPCRWVPLDLREVGERAHGWEKKVGMRPVPVWEAQEQWDSLQKPRGQSFDELVRSLRAHFPDAA